MNPLTIRKKMMTSHIFDRRNISVKILLILGVIVSILSIRIMYGMASGEEELCMSVNLFTALVINPDTANYSNESVEVIRDKSNHEVENLICITQINEKAFVVGWEGFSPTRWFAHTSGRFFSHDEEQQGIEVAYISESVYRNQSSPKEVVLDDRVYSVIGVGGIVDPTFQNVVPEESIVQLIPDGPMDTQNPYTWVVIPYENYKECYVPDQILVHYLDITAKELKENVETLSEEFSKGQVLMPRYSIDEENRKVLKEYNGLALFVLGLAMISLVQLLKEWILAEGERIRIYHLCGMSRMRCVARMIIKTGMLFVIGTVCGAIIYQEILPMLGEMCSMGEIEISKEIGAATMMLMVLEVETIVLSWNLSSQR